jgi:hypothetical protein
MQLLQQLHEDICNKIYLMWLDTKDFWHSEDEAAQIMLYQQQSDNERYEYQ